MKRIVSFLTALSALCMGAPQLPAPAYAETVSVQAETDADTPDFSCIGAVGTLSAAEAQNVAKTVYQSIQAHLPEVSFKEAGFDLTGQNINDVIGIYRTVISCWDAGILAINNDISYNTYYDIITLNYRFGDDEYDAQLAAYSGMLDEILSGVRDTWTDVEKALYLHDYLAVNYDYDYDAYYGRVTRENRADHSAYGMLTNHLGVCEGYSDLYAMLLNRLGIDALKIISEELHHAWNMIRIDGNWYYVDVTWDDNYTQYAGIVPHNNFLRTGAQMAESNHNAADWLSFYTENVCDLAVPETFSNAFWLETDSAILPWQGGWVSVGRAAPCTLFLHRNIQPDGTSEAEPVAELEYAQYKWPVWDKPGYNYTRNYVAPAVIGNTLFFTTPTGIYALLSPENAVPVPVYELTEAERAAGFLYGLYANGSTLRYGIDTSIRSHAETFNTPVQYYSLTEAEWSKNLPEDDLRYDLNNDNNVTVHDAVALARYVNENAPEGTFLAERADFDQDAVISIGDLTVLLQVLQ